MRREGLSAREYTQSLLGPLLAASASSTPMAARSERYSAGDAARALATEPVSRHQRPLSPRLRRALTAAPPGPRRGPGERLVREVGEAALRLEPLEGAVELEGVGGLEPPPRLE